MPGPGGQQINSLMDLMQPAQAEAPPRTYGSWDPDAAYYMQPSPPLYSGGGVGGIGMGGGGGTRAFSPPQELAKYFDQFGNPRIDDPRQVAAEAGITPGQLAGGLLPRYANRADQRWGQGYEFPSDKGGFFRTEDLFGLTGTPTQAPIPGPAGQGAGPGRNMQMTREGAIPVPQIATWGMSAPSTNNWRLLAPWGGGVGDILRNGMLIKTRDSGTMWGYPAGQGHSGGASGEQSMPWLPIALGTGAAHGMPNMLATGIGPPSYHWPGGTSWTDYAMTT
jgi:hypothetical protein